ncbi:TonB-dependent siderophore receptor [Rubrivivax albus]|uniref:TonB-dependent siderophore receptor n=1 Tax=Rubrivivax albus TaxID=2499835 RepID=A0A437JNZ5_9BURK|nr:TonB-dependent siderophore receptor [Rubrivivax albus]RVT48503.1 TonB-dependent siderophore receptor [Rubrivivax albus]
MSNTRPTLLAAAAALCCATTFAQSIQTVTITGSRGATSAGVAGFGDVPLSRSPFSATVLEADALQDAGIASLGDITRLDAGLTDAYNAPGYWGQLAVRGFTLDNRFNFRRDGLPVNAETMLPTGNKAALELFKGTSGIQAGTSAPGGLVNLVVKRPTAVPLTTAAIEWTEPGTVALSADLSRSAGAFAWRLNAGVTSLDPSTRDSEGQARLLAAAGTWQLGAAGTLEAEVEVSRQRQPSTPGFSLLSDRLPDADEIDPRLNLNNQAWSLPVVFDGRTGSLRYTRELGPQLQFTAQAMQQRLQTDDRIAFPFGCSAEDDYTRYCSDGSFDLYDFRSEGERRTTTATDLALQGRHTLGGVTHQWSTGLLATRATARFGRQAYNWVGVGSLDGRTELPPDPTLTDENTHRSERSTEWRVQDVMALNERWQLWVGLRHTRLQRASVRTDGSRATDYTQGFTTPWLALSWQATPTLIAYASWGEGVESEVAPNRARYLNAGQALPALKSRQIEIGLKQRRDGLQWQVALFDIRRPVWSDILQSTGLASDSCSDDDPCTRRADGIARHRGVEAEAEWRAGALNLRGSALWLQARRQGASDPALDGLRPTNVPAHSLKLQAAWNVDRLPGLAVLGFLSREGERMVLPDNSAGTAGWTRVDLGLRYARIVDGQRWTWRLGLDNVADARAWKESPYQYGHAYLYPLAPRTWRAALNITL